MRLLKLLIFCLAFLTVIVDPLYSQFSTGTSEVAYSQNFYEMQEEMNAYFDKNPGLEEQKHWGRFESFIEPRVYPHGNIAQYTRMTIAAQDRFFSNMSDQLRSPHGNWGFIGPSSSPNGSFGRCLRAKFHPSNSNLIFVLSSSGGLWKSVDNAATWINITLDIPMLFAIDFVVDPANPDIIYLLTGNDKQPTGGRFTQGILKTSDGGNTWYKTDFTFPSSTMPYKLVMHPDTADIMFAGVRTAGYATIYRTDDAWDNASLVYQGAFNSNLRDIEFMPGDPTVMIASSNTRVIRSTNRGLLYTWAQVTDPDFGRLDTMFRIELAFAPSNPNCIYLVASDIEAEYVMRSLSGGVDSTWTVMSDTANLFFEQAGYNMSIAVDPLDQNTVFVGAIALWKSTTGGMGDSWISKGGTHADHHDLVYHNGSLYDLNDGGVGRSANGGDSWTNITAGIHVFETYDIAGTPQNSNLIYAGGQDTGGNRIDSGGVFVAVCSSCTGDVTMCLQDPTEVDKSYMANQKGGMQFTSDGWMTSTSAGPGSGANFEPEYGNGLWLCPYELDPGNPDFIFTGKDSVWRLNVKSQTSQWLGVPEVGKTRAIAQGTNNRNKMYVIHGNGNNLYSTSDALTSSSGGATWTAIPNDFSVNAMMRDVTVNPQDADEVYIVYSGNDAGNKVFFSASAGGSGSWQNISGSLPNVPVNDIIFHDNGLNNHAIYIGTDIGVFYRDDSLSDWVFFSQGMPSTPVMELYINTTSNEILAGTLGRGVWRAGVFSSCPLVILLTGSTDNGGQRYYTAINTVSSYRKYDNTSTTDIHYQAGGFIEMFPPFQVKTPGLFRAKPGGCPQVLD